MNGSNKLIMIWKPQNSCSKENDIMYDFVFTLNRVSVLTRYPDNLQRMLNEYNMDTTENILEKGKELLKWLETK